MYRTNLKKGQTGQSIVLAMFLMLVAAASMIVLYNTAQTATEKTRLVNASDAAAYSGAVWSARQLNFMAYTNRAMIANHIMVGHMVSYVSWLRYVEDELDRIEDVTDFLSTILGWVPYLGPVLKAVDKGADLLATAAEKMEGVTTKFGKVFINGVDKINTVILRGAQNAAKFNMTYLPGGISPISEIMSNTAKFHSAAGDIKVNNVADLATFSGGISGLSVASDFLRLRAFTKEYIPYGRNTRQRMKFVVENSYGGSENWLNNRNWDANYRLLAGFRMQKRSSTSQSLPSSNRGLGNWQAEDHLRYKAISTVWKWKKSGRGSAKSNERALMRRYKGISNYYDLKKLNPSEKNQTLKITSYATMPFTQARLKTLMGLGGAPEKMAALSRAEIYHHRPARPVGGGASSALMEMGEFLNLGNNRKNTEYPNVYNPFWQARLIAPPSIL